MKHRKTKVTKTESAMVHPFVDIEQALLAGQAFCDSTINLGASLSLSPASYCLTLRQNSPVWYSLDFYPIFLCKPLQNKSQGRRQRPKLSVYAGQDVTSHLGAGLYFLLLLKLSREWEIEKKNAARQHIKDNSRDGKCKSLPNTRKQLQGNSRIFQTKLPGEQFFYACS